MFSGFCSPSESSWHKVVALVKLQYQRIVTCLNDQKSIDSIEIESSKSNLPQKVFTIFTLFIWVSTTQPFKMLIFIFCSTEFSPLFRVLDSFYWLKVHILPCIKHEQNSEESKVGRKWGILNYFTSFNQSILQYKQQEILMGYHCFEW